MLLDICAGKRPLWWRPFVVAMLQTSVLALEDIPYEVRRRFATIIFDEGHHVPAATFQMAANVFYGNRLGLTATYEREDGLHHILERHVGPIFYKNLEGDLTANVYAMDTDIALDLEDEEVLAEITVLRSQWDRRQKRWVRKREFQHAMLARYLGSLNKRNHLIVDCVTHFLRQGRRILVLSQSPDHVQNLVDVMRDIHDTGVRVGAVTGDTPARERTSIIRDAHVTFATIGVAREGLDATRLDTVIFATPFSAWATFQQGKGRAERAVPGKKPPIALLLRDNLIPVANGTFYSLARKMKRHGIRYIDIRDLTQAS